TLVANVAYPGIDCDLSAERHRVPRVQCQVDERCLELRRVDERGGQVTSTADLKAYGIAEGAFQHQFDITQERSWVDRLRHQALAAGECQKLSGELGATPDGTQCTGDQLARSLALLTFILKQLQAS